jgi:hypothetical protein
MEATVRGQWIGPFKGTNEGVAVVELDDMGDHFEGSAFAYSNNPALPSIWAFVRTPNKDAKFDLNVAVKPIDSQSAKVAEWDNLKDRYPGVTLSPDLNISWEFTSDELILSWKTPIGTNGTANLLRSRATSPSNYVGQKNINTWAAFKEFTVSLEPYRFAFRGQESRNWRLVTHFHRSGRFDLMKFVNTDIAQLHAHLSSLTTHHFDLDHPLQNAAFYSLVQHHGYPTPLLDWTFSPYIAAFFAFRKIRKIDQKPGEFVRIFVFDVRSWNNDQSRVSAISPALPHFTFLSPLSINNSRMVPQQAISSVANVDDIENFIEWHEKRTGKSYLSVIDLPANERTQIMQELAMMGITSGSLFPGLDGACEQLKERYFNL